jgi:hypothetical protein
MYSEPCELGEVNFLCNNLYIAWIVQLHTLDNLTTQTVDYRSKLVEMWSNPSVWPRWCHEHEDSLEMGITWF